MTIRIVVATAVVLLATSVAGQQEAATVQRVLLDPAPCHPTAGKLANVELHSAVASSLV